MKNLNLGKFLAVGITALLVLLASTSAVRADGDETKQFRKVCSQTTKYGGDVETTCWEEEIPTEEVVTEVIQQVDTGIVENVIIAGVMFAVGYAVLAYMQRESLLKI